MARSNVNIWHFAPVEIVKTKKKKQNVVCLFFCICIRNALYDGYTIRIIKKCRSEWHFSICNSFHFLLPFSFSGGFSLHIYFVFCFCAKSLKLSNAPTQTVCIVFSVYCQRTTNRQIQKIIRSDTIDILIGKCISHSISPFPVFRIP